MDPTRVGPPHDSDGAAPSAQNERVVQFLEALLPEWGAYHRHKEAMAHAGLLLQMAIAGWVVSAETWPPKWIPTWPCSPWVSAVAPFVLPWLAAHMYVRWQLSRRRFGAFLSAAIERVLGELLTGKAHASDEKAGQRAPVTEACILRVLDLFWPVKRAVGGVGIDRRGYPARLVQAWEEERNTTPGGLPHERLLAVGSVLLLGLGLLRTLVK